MKITLTQQAISQLKKQMNAYPDYYLCVTYEVGGCGSQLDGLFRLLLVRSLGDMNVRIQTNHIPIYASESTIMFMDQEMVIDFKPGGYVVKSPKQIYSYSMSIDIEP